MIVEIEHVFVQCRRSESLENQPVRALFGRYRRRHSNWTTRFPTASLSLWLCARVLCSLLLFADNLLINSPLKRFSQVSDVSSAEGSTGWPRHSSVLRLQAVRFLKVSAFYRFHIEKSFCWTPFSQKGGRKSPFNNTINRREFKAQLKGGNVKTVLDYWNNRETIHKQKNLSFTFLRERFPLQTNLNILFPFIFLPSSFYVSHPPRV